MERLNDIIGRAAHSAHRRPQYSDQRASQAQSPTQAFAQTAQSQRPEQSEYSERPERPERSAQGQQMPSTRPPIHEQNARQGYQRPYAQQNQSAPTNRGQRESTNFESRSSHSNGQPPNVRPVSSRPTQSTPNYLHGNRPNAYSSQRSERQPIPEQPVVHPMQTRSVYIQQSRADEYALSPVAPSDVAESWEDDDDESGMQYGDWEEGESEPSSYQRPSQEPQTYARGTAPMQPTQPRNDYSNGYPQNQQNLQSPQHQQHLQHPLMTRELARPSLSPLNRATREIQPTQSSQPAQSASSPTPPVRVQEVRHIHRATQPLNPRVSAELGRERMATQVQAPQHMQQRPLRQIAPQPQDAVQSVRIAREQTVMPYRTSTALPEVLPLLQNKSVCPLCKGAGYLRANVPFGHPNFGKPLACECKEAEKKEKRRQQLLELSDLGAFRAKSLANFSTHFPGIHPAIQEAYEVAQDYAQDPYGWLLLVGPNGCGKTHLAASIANKCLDSGSVVLFAVVPDLLAHLRAAFAPTAPEGYDQLFSKMREAELLVLDDLGSHQSSPWANEKLFQLLNYRYNSQYPTVITANRSGISSVDDRILSRLNDVNLVHSVVMDGAQDYRRRNPRRD